MFYFYCNQDYVRLRSTLRRKVGHKFQNATFETYRIFIRKNDSCFRLAYQSYTGSWSPWRGARRALPPKRASVGYLETLQLRINTEFVPSLSSRTARRPQRKALHSLPRSAVRNRLQAILVSWPARCGAPSPRTNPLFLSCFALPKDLSSVSRNPLSQVLNFLCNRSRFHGRISRTLKHSFFHFLSTTLIPPFMKIRVFTTYYR